MSSTVGSRFQEGQIAATAAALEVRTLGFKPRKVKVTNKTSLASLEWSEALGDGAGWKQVAAGTRTLVSADGITALTGENPGFSVGALADINDAAGEELVWEATE